MAPSRTTEPASPVIRPGPPATAGYARRVRAERATHDERAAAGKALRHVVPLSAHAETTRGARPDPLAVLEAQAAARVPQLVPIRYGRMLASPFTFFRGAAAVMAADLGSTPHSGLMVQLCGDAHLSNFGFYSTPERNQAFDINDFDETYPGPFEWDVKRLAASVAVASLVSGFSPKKASAAALASAAEYRQEIRRLAPLGNLEVWYSHQDIPALLKDIKQRVGSAAQRHLNAGLTKARYRDSNDALRKLCVTVDGQVQFRNDPPLIIPGEELLAAWGEDVERWYGQIRSMIADYREGLQSDRRHLLDQYAFVQLGFKVVGVGSVGTRAYIVLMDGAGPGDPLILQAKEASRSVLADHVTPATDYPNQGERVVHGQRLTQMTSDIFLGSQRVHGIDGQDRDFYIRQLRDGKGSVVVEQLDPATMAFYGGLCGKTLARAHARSGDRVAIAAYLGRSDAFDRAIADYAMHYAELNERDHAELRLAADDGRIIAREGI
ncbi:DUF2252 domain-containing protein [Nakamurella sp. GG22]